MTQHLGTVCSNRISMIRIAVEDGSLYEVAKPKEIEQLREKLQNVKDV